MENVSSLGASVAHLATYRQVAHYSRRLSLRRLVNAFVIGGVDAVMLALAATLASVLPFLPVDRTLVPSAAIFLLSAWWLGAALVGLLPGWGLSAVEHLRRQVVLLTLLFSCAALLTLLAWPARQFEAVALVIAWVLAIVFVPAGRMLSRHNLCLRQLFGMPTVVFGRAEAAADLIARLRTEQGLGYSAVGVCTDDEVELVEGVRVVGRLSQKNPFASAAIVASRGMTPEANEALIGRVLRAYRSVLILPDVTAMPSLAVLSRDLAGAVGLEISQELLSPLGTKLKRVIDICLVVASAPLWLPVCGAIYAAIWCEDRHNPIFRQERGGRKGRTFCTMKFRTMVTDAEAVLQRHLAADPALRAEWETHYKLRRDPRITRVGRILRRSSLDELPQLFNVLRGDMALVGPRPLPVYHSNSLPEPVRDIRHEVRPGLTGLWQVSGRSDAGNAGMVRWDPYYVRNWSLWLDIVILVRTFRVVLQGSGAR